MENNSTAKISLTKRELVSLIAVIEKEKERYDAINYEKLNDDEAGDIGDEHEVINGILSMLRATMEVTFK